MFWMKNTFYGFPLGIFLLYFLLILTFWFCIVLCSLLYYCVCVFNKGLNKLGILVSFCYYSINVLLSFKFFFGWQKKAQIVILQSEGTTGEGTMVPFLMNKKCTSTSWDTALGEYFRFTSFHWSLHKIPAFLSTNQDFTLQTSSMFWKGDLGIDVSWPSLRVLPYSGMFQLCSQSPNREVI